MVLMQAKCLRGPREDKEHGRRQVYSEEADETKAERGRGGYGTLSLMCINEGEDPRMSLILT